MSIENGFDPRDDEEKGKDKEADTDSSTDHTDDDEFSGPEYGEGSSFTLDSHV